MQKKTVGNWRINLKKLILPERKGKWSNRKNKRHEGQRMKIVSKAESVPEE